MLETKLNVLLECYQHLETSCSQGGYSGHWDLAAAAAAKENMPLLTAATGTSSSASCVLASQWPGVWAQCWLNASKLRARLLIGQLAEDRGRGQSQQLQPNTWKMRNLHAQERAVTLATACSPVPPTKRRPALHAANEPMALLQAPDSNTPGATCASGPHLALAKRCADLECRLVQQRQVRGLP